MIFRGKNSILELQKILSQLAAEPAFVGCYWHTAGPTLTPPCAPLDPQQSRPSPASAPRTGTVCVCPRKCPWLKPGAGVPCPVCQGWTGGDSAGQSPPQTSVQQVRPRYTARALLGGNLGIWAVLGLSGGCLPQNLPINRNSFIPYPVLDLFLYFWGIFAFPGSPQCHFSFWGGTVKRIVLLAHAIQAHVPCDLSHLSCWIYFGTFSDLSAGVRVWRSRINADYRGQSVAKEKKNHNFLTELRNLKQPQQT